MKLLVKWLINAVALLIVSRLVPGFFVRDLGTALLAALVFGFVNATLGLLLKILTFPLTILTLGFFLIIVNAIMLKLAASVTPGFPYTELYPAPFSRLSEMKTWPTT